MQRQHGAPSTQASPQLADGALNFISPGHKDQHIALAALKVLRNGICRRFPNGIIFRIMREMADFDRKHAALGCQDFRRLEVLLEFRAVERCRHDNDFQVRADCVLQIESPRESDVAIEVALVKFIEDQCGNPSQLRVCQHLTKKNAFGDEQDFRFF